MKGQGQSDARLRLAFKSNLLLKTQLHQDQAALYSFSAYVC
jgi:hypothetical protein